MSIMNERRDKLNTYKGYKVLVVDDDREIAASIGIYLEQEGMAPRLAYDGQQALDAIAEEDFHLILMDIMMPRLDGIRATLRIRTEKNIPIILISAKSEDSDKILGLNMGADDYITKPFNPLELVARVKSQLRRYAMLGAFPGKNGGTEAANQNGNSECVVTTGGLSLNFDLKTVTLEDEDIKLTPIEYRILRLLMQNLGRIFSIDEIYEKVWNEPNLNGENTVAVHIRRIREKIEINPKEPKYLKVVWGIGYKIDKQ